MRKAIGYIRVSTEMQAQEGVSLEAQRAKIQAWAELNDYQLVAIYEDAGLSGKNQNREGLQAALAQCGKDTALVVFSLSRLSRSVRDTMEIAEKLEKVGADLVSISEKIDTTTAAGKMVFRMLAVMNEFERDQISERTKSALAYKKAKGERVGGVPFGWMAVKGSSVLARNEGEQKIIAAIRSYRAAGLAMRAIVARLSSDGFKSRAGKPLGLTQVARILSDERKSV